MRTCEFLTNPSFQDDSDRPDYYYQHGLEIRAITNEETPGQWMHALQLNYGELVLWRRWTCEPGCGWHHTREGIP